jgi:hypothetical protein
MVPLAWICVTTLWRLPALGADLVALALFDAGGPRMTAHPARQLLGHLGLLTRDRRKVRTPVSRSNEGLGWTSRGTPAARRDYGPFMAARQRVGLRLTALSVVLFVVAVAGIAPFVAGGEPGSCSEDGPNALFLILWPVSALMGLGSAMCLSTGYRRPKGPAIRRAAFWTALLVPLGAVVLYFIVVADGVSECGF